MGTYGYAAPEYMMTGIYILYSYSDLYKKNILKNSSESWIFKISHLYVVFRWKKKKTIVA